MANRQLMPGYSRQFTNADGNNDKILNYKLAFN